MSKLYAPLHFIVNSLSFQVLGSSVLPCATATFTFIGTISILRMLVPLFTGMESILVPQQKLLVYWVHPVEGLTGPWSMSVHLTCVSLVTGQLSWWTVAAQMDKLYLNHAEEKAFMPAMPFVFLHHLPQLQLHLPRLLLHHLRCSHPPSLAFPEKQQCK